MATKTLITQPDGTPKQIVFADINGGGFSPSASNDQRLSNSAYRDSFHLTLSSLSNNNAQQSEKFDLGENWARAYLILTSFEFAATPSAGNSVEIYVAPSVNSTAGSGNLIGLTGSNGAYSGLSSNLSDSLKLLGNIPYLHTCTVDTATTVQCAMAGILIPTARYGSIVVYNKSGASFHSDDVENHIVFTPIVDELQN
jgi:hypothetical protein